MGFRGIASIRVEKWSIGTGVSTRLILRYIFIHWLFSLFWQLFNMNNKFHSFNLESLMNQIMNQTSLFYMAFYFVFENSWLWEFRHLQSLQSIDINTRVCRSRLFYFFRLRSCRSVQSIFLAKYHFATQ